jgi:hypothetical protein
MINKTIITIKNLVIDIMKYLDDLDNQYIDKYNKYTGKMMIFNGICKRAMNITNDSNELCGIIRYYIFFDGLHDDYDFEYDDILSSTLAYTLFSLEYQQFLSFFDYYSDCVYNTDLTDKIKDNINIIINKHKNEFIKNNKKI